MKKASKLLWVGLIIFPVFGCLLLWFALSDWSPDGIFTAGIMFVLTAIVYRAINNPQRGDDSVRTLGKLLIPAFLFTATADHGYRAYSEQSIWQGAMAVIFAIIFIGYLRSLRQNLVANSPSRTSLQ